MTVSTDITGTFAGLLAALLDAGSDVDFASAPSGYDCFVTTAQDTAVGSGPTPEAALEAATAAVAASVLQLPVATRPAGGNMQRPDATAEESAASVDGEPGTQLTAHQEDLIRAHYGDGVDMGQVRAQLAAGLYEFDFEGLEQDRTAREDGAPAGPPSWTYDGAQWRKQLPDGRTAVIERLAEGDGDGQGAAFLPRVYESASDFATGPVCGGVLAAGAWAEQFAGTAQ